MPQGQTSELRRKAGFRPGKQHNQDKGQHKGRAHGGKAARPHSSAPPDDQPGREAAAKQGQHRAGKTYQMGQPFPQATIVLLPAQVEQFLKNGHVSRTEGVSLGQ